MSRGLLARMLPATSLALALAISLSGVPAGVLRAQPTDAANQADPGAAAETSADPATGPTASPAAKEAFDGLQRRWADVIGQIRDLQQKRPDVPAGTAGEVDRQIATLRGEADALVTQLVEAALAVYRAAPHDYPQINATLLAIVQFYLVGGEPSGDGGDQYEKALPTLQALVAAGADKEWPYLWTWAGVAAYCASEFDLAGEYFAEAAEAGALGNTPPSRTPSDPRNKIRQMAKQYEESLPTLSKAWAKEQQIRAAEAQDDDLPRVKFTTDRGEIVIELFENEAPQAVANFITLVKQGFYDGVVFHRVLPGFMAQGGDPTGTGSGGPGYSIRCECYTPDMRRHFRGSLSMAHAGRDTGGSQFFLTFVPTSFLDGRHTVFGRVLEGMENAAAIKRRDPQGPNPPQPDRIIKAEVLRDRGHEYNFARLPGR